MPLSTEPLYLSADEFKANTRIAAQALMTAEALKPYLLHGERIVDAYVGHTEKYDIDQTMKFPIVNNKGNSEIPNEVKLACVEIVMNLILKGEPTLETYEDFESQEWSANGYKMKLRSNKGGQTISLQLPPLAARLLRPWAGNNSRLTFGF